MEAPKLPTLVDLERGHHLAKTGARLELVPEQDGGRRVGMAVVGCGRMGAIHLDNVVREPRAKLLYVFDASFARLEHMRRKYYLDERGVAAVAGDQGWARIMADPSVEAVFISTPTSTHERYTREALEHNKHVLCEKPLAQSSEQIAELVELANRKQLKLLCAFQRRYDPSFRQIQGQLRAGHVGQLRIIKTCSRDSPLPPIEYIKISGGIFHDCLVHDLDLILWLARELPTETYAVAHAYDPEYKALDDYDTALVTMKFKSGLVTSTDLSRLSSYGYDQRIEVYGDKGMLKVDEAPRHAWERLDELGHTKMANSYSFSTRYTDAYAAEVCELFNHIEGNNTLEPILPGYLLSLCKIVHACEESARSGLPVRLDWTAEELARPL